MLSSSLAQSSTRVQWRQKILRCVRCDLPQIPRGRHSELPKPLQFLPYACVCVCVCARASCTDGATGWLHVCSEAYTCVVTRYCKVLCEGCHMSPWVLPSHKIDSRKRKKKNVTIFRIHTCAAFAQTRTQSETDDAVLRLYLPRPSERQQRRPLWSHSRETDIFHVLPGFRTKGLPYIAS